MAKCPYNSSSEYCEIEVQLEVAKVAENEATETFHEMDAEIRRLLQRIELLGKTLQQYNIPIPEVEDEYLRALSVGLPAELFGGRGAGEVAESLRCCGRFSPCRWQTRADLCMSNSCRNCLGLRRSLNIAICLDFLSISVLRCSYFLPSRGIIDCLR